MNTKRDIRVVMISKLWWFQSCDDFRVVTKSGQRKNAQKVLKKLCILYCRCRTNTEVRECCPHMMTRYTYRTRWQRGVQIFCQAILVVVVDCRCRSTPSTSWLTLAFLLFAVVVSTRRWCWSALTRGGRSRGLGGYFRRIVVVAGIWNQPRQNVKRWEELDLFGLSCYRIFSLE